MTTSFYRLAVARDGATAAVWADHGGKLLPLARILLPDLAAEVSGWTDLAPMLAEWSRWDQLLSEQVPAAAARFAAEGQSASSLRFAPPVAKPDKLICIGANYHDHIAEMKIPMAPDYPFSFLKPAGNTLRGSGEAVQVPKIAQMVDWEAELGVVIGQSARDVAACDALDIVAGYTNFNDLSARDWLASRPAVGVDWVRHKAHDGFGPIGPYFVPARFVADPQNLPIRLSVNGEIKQDSSTSQMVFGVAAIIEHLSTIMTLEPGDIIATGTPAGVGHGFQPPQFLKAGDEVRLEIGDLGELVTPMI